MSGIIRKLKRITSDKLNLTYDNSIFVKNSTEIQKYNLRLTRQITFISASLMIALFLGNHLHPGLIINPNMYFAFFMLSAIIFTLTYIIFNQMLPYSMVLTYFFNTVFAVFAAAVGIAEPASGTSAFFMIVLAMLPMQILDRQTHVIPYTVFVWLTFCAFTWIMKEHNSAVADLISSTVAIIFGTLTNRYVFRARITAINNNRILAASTQTDANTGLPNYKKFNDDISGVNGSHIAQSICSLAIFEIDKFKEYNEKYGREAGDKCLKKIGSCLQRITDPGELILYRYSGTGFAAISLIHDYQGIERVSRGILALIRGLNIEYSGTPLGIVTLSAGYTDVMECECDEYHRLIEMATEAVEKAKIEGGNELIGWLELHPKPKEI